MRAFHYDNLKKDLFTPEIINMVSAIHEYKGRQELFIEAEPHILKGMLEVAKIQSTGASNRIEGIFTSDERLRELVAHKAEPRNRSEAEIAGYREVLATIHESYEYIAPSPNVILQLHRDLYAFTPSTSGGSWKNGDNVIAETDRDGQRRVRFNLSRRLKRPKRWKICVPLLLKPSERKNMILSCSFPLSFWIFSAFIPSTTATAA